MKHFIVLQTFSNSENTAAFLALPARPPQPTAACFLTLGGCSFPTKYWQPDLRLLTFSRSRPTFRGLSSRANLISSYFFLIFSSSERPNGGSPTRPGGGLASLVAKSFRIFIFHEKASCAAVGICITCIRRAKNTHVSLQAFYITMSNL